MEISNLAATNAPITASEPGTLHYNSSKIEVLADGQANEYNKISPKKEDGKVIRSKDGDTLEISNARLANYSKGKLMQLLQAGKISHQQYNKALQKSSKKL